MKKTVFMILVGLLCCLCASAQATANSRSGGKVSVYTTSRGSKTAMWLKSNTCYCIELLYSENGYFCVGSIENMEEDYSVKKHGSSSGYWIKCSDLVCYAEPGFNPTIYKSASSSSGVVGYVGSKSCTPLSVSGDWMKVRCGNVTGWVRTNQVGASA